MCYGCATNNSGLVSETIWLRRRTSRSACSWPYHHLIIILDGALSRCAMVLARESGSSASLARPRAFPWLRARPSASSSLPTFPSPQIISKSEVRTNQSRSSGIQIAEVQKYTFLKDVLTIWYFFGKNMTNGRYITLFIKNIANRFRGAHPSSPTLQRNSYFFWFSIDALTIFNVFEAKWFQNLRIYWGADCFKVTVRIRQFRRSGSCPAASALPASRRLLPSRLRPIPLNPAAPRSSCVFVYTRSSQPIHWMRDWFVQLVLQTTRSSTPQLRSSQFVP